MPTVTDPNHLNAPISDVWASASQCFAGFSMSNTTIKAWAAAPIPTSRAPNTPLNFAQPCMFLVPVVDFLTFLPAMAGIVHPHYAGKWPDLVNPSGTNWLANVASWFQYQFRGRPDWSFCGQSPMGGRSWFDDMTLGYYITLAR